jgi:23S rRNA (adenine2503-C2)-methyltransferase
MKHASKSINPARDKTPAPFRTDIKDWAREELTDWLKGHGVAAYRVDQIFKWVYQHQVDDFADMTNISKDIKGLLAENFTVNRLIVRKTQESADGTKKYLFALEDGACIESVLIPEEGHETICVSTQVGCAQGCRFCLTARNGFTRNLTPGEIIGQIRDVGNLLERGRKLTNIVFMGMGEPLANLKSVLAAIDVITDSDCGMKFSTRRVTLSTSGLVPGIKALGRATKINLAVSLNATDNRTRDSLMPINKKYPVEVLLAACAAYPLTHRQKITVEYILISGVNDTEQDARRLVKLLHPVQAKVNLIPFNEHPESGFKRPPAAVIERFKQILHDHHYTVMTRLSKGADISAACGQLSADEQQYGS